MSFVVRRVREEKKPSALRKYGKLALPAFRSLLALSEHFRHVEKQEEGKKRERNLKKTITILVAILVVLLLMIGTLKVVLRLKEIALGMVSLAGVELPKDENGFTNILLLGEGDDDHDGTDLTDTVMVASLDPKNTKSAVLLSIPRDTYLFAGEKTGKGRINSIYRDTKYALIRTGLEEGDASAEAMKRLNDEVGSLLGLQIHGSVKVNFSGFTEAVDAIGGIDITVPETLVDTEYPGPNYSYETFSISAGEHHIDGETALKYARSRHSTSDFSRSARQQQIIAAVGAKAKSQGIITSPSRLTDLLSIVAKNIESTFGTRELIGLATLGKSVDPTRIINLQLNDQNGLYGSLIQSGGFLYSPPRDQFEGAAVLLPVSIPEFPVTWKQIKSFVGFVTAHRDLYLHPTPLLVLNAGAVEGSARKTGGELERYGLLIEDIRNYAKGKNPSFDASFVAINPALTDDAKAEAEAAAEVLRSILGINGKEDGLGQAFAGGDGTIAIVLGKDFRYSPLQDRL